MLNNRFDGTKKIYAIQMIFFAPIFNALSSLLKKVSY